MHKDTNELGVVWNILDEEYCQCDFGTGRFTNGKTKISNLNKYRCKVWVHVEIFVTDESGDENPIEGGDEYILPMSCGFYDDIKKAEETMSEINNLYEIE